MENKIIITKYNDYQLVLDREVLQCNDYIDDYFFEDCFTDCESWEKVEEKAVDNLWEYVDGLVPCYYSKIKEEFNNLNYCKIDEIIQNNGIEYDGDFSRFQQAVLFYNIYEVAHNELMEALEAMEEEEEVEEDKKIKITSFEVKTGENKGFYLAIEGTEDKEEDKKIFEECNIFIGGILSPVYCSNFYTRHNIKEGYIWTYGGNTGHSYNRLLHNDNIIKLKSNGYDVIEL